MGRYLGFCGGFFISASQHINDEEAINLYPEAVANEAPAAKTSIALLSSPGTSLFAALGSTSILGLFACRPNSSIEDRVFAVVQSGLNQELWEIFSDGTKTNRGALTAPTTSAVTIETNGKQLALCTGGQIFVYDLTTNAAPTVPAGVPTNIGQIAYCDGFFLALERNSSIFYRSGLLDGTSWNTALWKAEVSEFPDNVVSMKVNQRGIWFQGIKATVPYYNAGATEMPFVPVDGVFIENGSGAYLATTRLDNSLFWIDADERGSAIARRANGYTPTRISTHAVEAQWRKYSRIDDAIGYAFQDGGHTFWHVYFPTADMSWRFDASTGLWAKALYWSSPEGVYHAHHSQNHCFAWGKHLVGDWSSGNVYEMSERFYDDAGSPIRRLRRAPHLSAENKRLRYAKLTLDLEVGTGPQPPLTDGTNPRGPYVSMRYSDDHGHTWSNEKIADVGQAGEYTKRVIWTQLGQARTRTFEVTMTDPVPWRLVDAYLEAAA